MSTESEPAATEERDVEALGRELGGAIADLPEYQQFEAAKEAVESDPEAQERIREFEELREEFALARRTGEATQEDLREVQEAQQELHSIPVLARYLERQETLIDRLEAVNEAISEPLAIDFGGEAGGCCQD